MGPAAPIEAAVNIEAFGAIQADLAAGVARADVLASARITDAQLATTTQHWLRAMAEEVKRGRTALSQRYAKAYLQRRPDLARDPEEDADRLALATSSRKPAAAAEVDAQEGTAPHPPPPPPHEDPAPRELPSYMREESTSDRTGPPAPPMQPIAPVPQTPVPARSWLDPPTMPSAPVVSYAAAPGAPVSQPRNALAMTAMPDLRRGPATPFAQAPASSPTASATASAPPAVTATVSARPSGKGSLTGTAMSFDVPASFKAVPFEGRDKPPPSAQAPSAPAPPAPTAPPTSAPPESLPFEPPPKKSAPMTGTMMAMDIPASFKAVPFSSDAPPSARPPASAVAVPPPSAAAAPSSATPSTPRGSLSGTALAFDVPEHLKKIPLTGGPPSAAPRSVAAPPSQASHSQQPPAQPHHPQQPYRAPSQPSLPALPSLPPLEDYVRIGVDLAATPADRVDAYLAQARWTRATWATVDQTYRARFAREPELQAAFQNALARERARRAGGPR